MSRRAVIYTRVSRDDSGEGKSNDRQREDCTKLAELRGWTVAAVEEDISISAYGQGRRPAWQRVLDMIERGEVDVVIAWHIDRMTRNMADLEHLIVLSEDKGVGVATVSGDIDLTTDVGRMVARILAAVARAEVERKGARQRRANQQRAAEGIPWSGGWRALGYEKAGKDTVKVVEHEAEHIRQAAEDVLNGTALNEIKRRWGSAGLSTPRSSKGKTKAWTHSGVRSVLLNPRYAGMATYRGEIIGTGNWNPILTTEQHTLLVAKLTDPRRKFGGPKHFGVAENLLSGIAICARCGKPVSAGNGHKGTPIYQCSDYHTSTYRAEADEAVRAAFAMAVALTGPGRVVPLARSVAPDDLLGAADRVKERLSALSTSFAEGRIGIEQLESASASLRHQLREIEAQVQEANEASGDPLTLRSQAARDFLQMNLAGQRGVLAELAEIKLYPKGRGRKSVPIDQQVTMYVRNVDGRWFPALDERPAT